MAPLKVKSRVSSLTCVTVPRYCSTGFLCSMTSTTLNGFGLEPQWDFSTFRCQLPEKLAVCPAQTPSATERNVGTNHERVLMADSSCVQVPTIGYPSGPRRGRGSSVQGIFCADSAIVGYGVAGVDRHVSGVRRHPMLRCVFVHAVLVGKPESNVPAGDRRGRLERKSTRLNSSHLGISYAVFCL